MERRDFIKKMGMVGGAALIGGAVLGNLEKISNTKEPPKKETNSTITLTPITGGGYYNIGYFGPLMLSGAIVDFMKEKGL